MEFLKNQDGTVSISIKASEQDKLSALLFLVHGLVVHFAVLSKMISNAEGSAFPLLDNLITEAQKQDVSPQARELVFAIVKSAEHTCADIKSLDL